MQKVTVISSMATRNILNDLAVACRAATGVAVEITSVGGVDAAKRIAAGEAFDIVCLASGAMRKLETDGHVVAGSVLPVARSEIAVAVPAGAPAPDLSSVATVKAAMLAARRVGYSTGPSGDHILKLWSEWGIMEQMKDRALLAPPGVPVAALVARGEADLGLQQLSELMGQDGITIAGALPDEAQLVTIFSGGVARASGNADIARSVLQAFTAPEAAATVRKYGMSPP